MAKAESHHYMCDYRAIHTPSMSPHLPVTPDEIADAAVGAAEAGAAMRAFARARPETGKPDQPPEAFAPFLSDQAATNAVMNMTSGGGPS